MPPRHSSRAAHTETARVQRGLQLEQSVQQNIDGHQRRKKVEGSFRQEEDQHHQKLTEYADGEIELEGQAVKVVGKIAEQLRRAGQTEQAAKQDPLGIGNLQRGNDQQQKSCQRHQSGGDDIDDFRAFDNGVMLCQKGSSFAEG